MNRRGIFRGVAVVATAIALYAAMFAPLPAQASAAVMGPGLNLKAGAHHSISPTLHAGYWIVSGRKLVCISYNSAAPDGSVSALSSPLPMPSAEADARAKFVVNTYGGSSDAHVAARIWFTLAHLLADSGSASSAGLRADLPGYTAQLSAEDRAAVQAMLAASTLHGPYRVTLSSTQSVPGQPGSVTATVLAANGRPVPARTVAFAATGATLTPGVKITGTNGQAVADYTATALSPAFTATVTAPSSSTVYVNAPSKGHQVVIGGGFTETATARTTYTVCPLTLKVVTTCACGKGAATRSFEFTAALPGRYVVRLIHADGGELAHQSLTSGQTTLSLPASMHDVTASYDMLDAAGRTVATFAFDPDVTR